MFLNCLSRLIPTIDGDIFMDNNSDPRKHNISFGFQEPTCMQWRTVRQNVAYGMEVKKFPREELIQKLDNILNLTGFLYTADLYPNQVSAA